jgi:hypothetical protein
MSKIKNCIPKRCYLGGVEFITRFVENVANGGKLGDSCTTDGSINIQVMNYGLKQCHTQIQNTYFHELAHNILGMIGRIDLSDDEVLVQNIGNMLFEFMRTADWIRIEELKHNNESEATFNFQTLNQSQLK